MVTTDSHSLVFACLHAQSGGGTLPVRWRMTPGN
jgi:hypothetical protein